MPDYTRQIDEHYGRPELGDLILHALRAAGKNPDRLDWTDLTPVDQFHTRGRDATLELAGLARVRREDRVLDVGGGSGGAARTLAATVGCHVTVLDLTESYTRAGEMLTERTGLGELVTFHTGNALALPFPDGRFDVVWTQHSAMNVADKERLYREFRRVLRPGGRFAMHELMAGEVQPIHFPVPWASHAEISFLQPAGTVRALVAAAGFAELAWNDVTAPSVEWFRQRAAASSAGPSALGLHMLIGERFGMAFWNQVRNLEEGRVAIVEAVFEAR